MKNSIYPCLWFDGNAIGAATFYCSVFRDSAITADTEYVATFESAGKKFMCLNGGAEFTFNASVSFFVVCETEAESDQVWKSLLDGGSVLMAYDTYAWSKKYGWLQDKYGVNWQISWGDIQEVGQKFSPCLLFTGKQHGRAEQAVHFYTSVFEDSGVTGMLRYTGDDKEVEGTVKHSQFTLRKHVFMAMDSSLMHDIGFNESISFVVECETQGEIDYFWNKLTDGGEESQCGWLKDKFGVSWQIVPSILGRLMSDPERSGRVTQAFLQMKKFDIEKLVNA
jgi:predicted 3-demethylubiquinone-9 3-methyltransferase (glyoxalase superfamily)